MKNKKLYILAILIIAFIINTILVITNAYTAFDASFHNLVMRYASEMTSKVMRAITFLGSTVFIVALCAVVFFGLILKKRKAQGYSIASILIVSTLINNVIKLIIRRPRPEYISVIEHSFSYPSGHTMASTTLYGFIIYLILKSDFPKRYKVIYSCALGLLILLVGLSRIYLGAHFFSDVFGGMLLSAALLLTFDIINDEKKLIK